MFPNDVLTGRRRSSREQAKQRAEWVALEEFTRERIRLRIQELLEEEVTEGLGRRRSERRAAVDAPAGYRNGYGKPRKLAMMAGTIALRRPRVRGLEQRFESRILPLFVWRTWASFCRSFIWMDWRRVTSSWRCGVFWARGRRFRRPRSNGCAGSGRWSTRPGKAGGWMSLRWYMRG